jgi:hypothetical protein
MFLSQSWEKLSEALMQRGENCPIARLPASTSKATLDKIPHLDSLGATNEYTPSSQ